VASAAREAEVQKASLRSHIEGLVARGVTDGLGPFITALTGTCALVCASATHEHRSIALYTVTLYTYLDAGMTGLTDALALLAAPPSPPLSDSPLISLDSDVPQSDSTINTTSSSSTARSHRPALVTSAHAEAQQQLQQCAGSPLFFSLSNRLSYDAFKIDQSATGPKRSLSGEPEL
jgi:hypothetical protein